MFEDLQTKMQEFGVLAKQKAGEAKDLAVLMGKNLKKKKELSRSYAELGKAFYEAHKDEALEFEEEIEAIKNLQVELDALEEEIKDMKAKLPEGIKTEEVVEETEEEAAAETEEAVAETEEAAAETEEIAGEADEETEE